MFILTLFCHPCLKEGETDFLRPLFSIQLLLVAELRRAKRASGAPWVIKFGKPSIRENLVMT